MAATRGAAGALALVSGSDLFEARVARLEATVERLRQRLDEPGGDDDARRLHAIAHAVGDHVFSAQELRDHGRVDPGLGVALAGLTTPIEIGRWLRGVMDRPITGLMVRRIGRDRCGIVWSVQSIDDQHSDAGDARESSA